ncbi:MAG: hypothetical protein MUC36_07250 [Planctomycetes bacterium]|nr:hypothetical protein [Planctomycetota bacterium]
MAVLLGPGAQRLHHLGGQLGGLGKPGRLILVALADAVLQGFQQLVAIAPVGPVVAVVLLAGADQGSFVLVDQEQEPRQVRRARGFVFEFGVGPGLTGGDLAVAVGEDQHEQVAVADLLRIAVDRGARLGRELRHRGDLEAQRSDVVDDGTVIVLEVLPGRRHEAAEGLAHGRRVAR